MSWPVVSLQSVWNLPFLLSGAMSAIAARTWTQPSIVLCRVFIAATRWVVTPRWRCCKQPLSHTETHWDTLHNLPVTESLNWDNLWVLISLSELGCKIRVYLCIVLADKGGCKILYLRPSHCQSCWFLQLLNQLPETLFFICNSHRW